MVLADPSERSVSPLPLAVWYKSYAFATGYRYIGSCKLTVCVSTAASFRLLLKCAPREVNNMVFRSLSQKRNVFAASFDLIRVLYGVQHRPHLVMAQIALIFIRHRRGCSGQSGDNMDVHTCVNHI